jgi:hypothetical protein
MRILALIPESNKRSPARIYVGDAMLERLPGVEIDYFTQENTRWEWVDWMRAAKKYDWFFVMRSAHIEHLNHASMAKTFGLKIWYTLDDDYTGVEPDNTAYLAFQKEDTQTAWKWFVKNADLMTVSTKHLQDKFGGELCPNALDDLVYPMDIEYPGPNEKLITWRGGGSHFQDLQAFEPEINKFLTNRPGMTIHFMGFYAWFFSQHKNAKFTEYIPDYWYYMQVLRQQKPWGHIAPLRDCAFNQGKSCIAGLESVYAGAVPIVPNWVEWPFPAALKYDNPEQFSQQLQLLCEMSKEEHKERWIANMAWIKENRILSVVNQKRMDLLCH